MKDGKSTNPFAIWPDTNTLLEEYYTRPNINLKDDNEGLFRKNTMRHIVGSARMQNQYPYLAKPLGVVKEIWDLQTEPLAYMYLNKSLNYPKYLKKTVIDTVIDSNNNRIGRDYIKSNPNASNEDIINYANKVSKNMYSDITNSKEKIGQNLYDLLLED